MCLVNPHLLKSLGLPTGEKETPTNYGTNAAGQTLYPDKTANAHSGPAYQESLRISQQSQGTLKGDQPLNSKQQSSSSDIYNA